MMNRRDALIFLGSLTALPVVGLPPLKDDLDRIAELPGLYWQLLMDDICSSSIYNCDFYIDPICFNGQEISICPLSRKKGSHCHMSIPRYEVRGKTESSIHSQLDTHTIKLLTHCAKEYNNLRFRDEFSVDKISKGFNLVENYDLAVNKVVISPAMFRRFLKIPHCENLIDTSPEMVQCCLENKKKFVPLPVGYIWGASIYLSKDMKDNEILFVPEQDYLGIFNTDKNAYQLENGWYQTVGMSHVKPNNVSRISVL